MNDEIGIMCLHKICNITRVSMKFIRNTIYILFSAIMLFLCSCNRHSDLLISTSAINPVDIKEKTFSSQVLNNIYNINDSITIFKIPDEIIDDSQDEQSMGSYAIINNREEPVLIEVVNMRTVYKYDKDNEEWSKVSVNVINATGNDYVELKRFRNDWVNIGLFTVDLDLSKMGEDDNVIRLVTFGEVNSNGEVIPIAAWLEISVIN